MVTEGCQKRENDSLPVYIVRSKKAELALPGMYGERRGFIPCGAEQYSRAIREELEFWRARRMVFCVSTVLRRLRNA